MTARTVATRQSGGAGAGLLPTAAATCQRILRVFVRSPQLLGATLGQGVLFLLVFRYVFGGALDTGTLTSIDYVAPGIVVATVIFAASAAAAGTAQDRADGFTDRVLAFPVSRAGLVAGRFAADTIVIAAAAAVTTFAAVAVGLRPHSTGLALIAAILLVVFYAAAFAALFGMLGMLADGPQTAQSLGFVAIPLTFVSSAYVPTGTMPAWLAVVARHQPVTIMVDALRALTHARVVGYDARTTLLAVAIVFGMLVVAATISRWRIARA